MHIVPTILFLGLVSACSAIPVSDAESTSSDPVEILAGIAEVPIGTSETGYAWFSDRRSIQCVDGGDYTSSLFLVISDIDACGELTRNPCSDDGGASMLFISITNRGPGDQPIRPRTYTLSGWPSMTGHNEDLLRINGFFTDASGMSIDDEGIDSEGMLSWSGSFTINVIDEVRILGSVDLVTPQGAYVGSFTALKCAYQQEVLQGPICFGDPPIRKPECP